MNNDIRKLVDDNWDEIKELIAQKAEAEQKPKNIWDLKTEDYMTFIRVAQFHYLGGPVFASEEIAQKVIDEIGEDRLIKYWFGVTE